jgi:hypothetical protein
MSVLISREELAHAPSIDEIRENSARRLQSLMRTLSDIDRAAAEFSDLRTVIESLPMPSGEFSLAKNRLRNAQRYLRSDEAGAARYELCLLLGSLRWY